MARTESTELPTWKLNREEQPLLIGGSTSRAKSPFKSDNHKRTNSNNDNDDDDDDSSNESIRDRINDDSKFINVNGNNSDNPNYYYPLWVAGCFLVNYTVGAGVLGLPYAFYQSGYIQSSVLLGILSFLNYCGCLWTVNAMYRGEAVTTIATRAGVRREVIMKDPDATLSAIKGISMTTFRDNYHIQRNEYQLNELVGIFCGYKWRLFYEISFLIAMIATLWAYSVLFAVSLTRAIGVPGISDACDIDDGETKCIYLYYFYVVIFLIWTIIISLIDFSEQAMFQVILCAMRFFVVFLMVFLVIGLMYSHYSYDGDTYSWNKSNKIPHVGSGLTAGDIYYMATFISIATLALRGQIGLTDVITPLHPHERHSGRENNNHVNPPHTKIYRMLGYVSLFVTILYLISSFCISLYFGDETESPCTLAFAHFKGFTERNHGNTLDSIVQYLIVLFPALDMTSAYPVTAITTGNTLLAMISDSPDDRSFRDHPWGRVLTRVSLCTVSAVLALGIRSFDTSVTIAGVIFLIGFSLCLCYLEYASMKMCQSAVIQDSDLRPVWADSGDTYGGVNSTDRNLETLDILKTDWTSHNIVILLMAISSIIGGVGGIITLVSDNT